MNKTRAISMRFTEAQLEVIDALVDVRRQQFPWRTWGRAEVIVELLDGIEFPARPGPRYDRLRRALDALEGRP